MGRRKVDALILRLTFLALFLAAAYEAIGIAQRSGITLFGFRCRIFGQGNGGTGAVVGIHPKQLKKILEGRPVPKALVFSTDIYSARPGRVFFHVNRPASIFLTVNGRQIPLGSQKFFHPLQLKKGFNRMILRYSPLESGPEDLSVSLSENAALLPFPFSRLVLPGKPVSLPRIAFFLVRFLDIGRTWAFLLALILIFVSLPRFFSLRQDVPPAPPPSFPYLIFQFAINLFCLSNILIFCTNMLGVSVSLIVLLWLSGFIDLVVLLCAVHRRPVACRWARKKTAVFFAISAFVLLYAFLTAGSFLPLKPIGKGDLNAHLGMIHHIRQQGRFMDEENRRIYPQSTHAVIVLAARILGMQPEALITPFFMSMLVLFFFAIFLLGSALIPGIPLFIWILAFGISHFLFIFQGVLVQSSFPAVVSVSLFLLSLFFHRSGSFPSSSIALAASLVVYPYFALAFLTGAVVYFLWVEGPFCLRKWNRLSLGLLPSIGVMGIYAVVFIAHGFLQQKEGLATAFLLNPFLSLRFWITALIFFEVVFLFDSEYPKPALGLFSAITSGFLINYVPYALFRATSTYYVMKNMIVLIAFGMIFAAGALAHIFRRFRGSATAVFGRVPSTCSSSGSRELPRGVPGASPGV